MNRRLLSSITAIAMSSSLAIVIPSLGRARAEETRPPHEAKAILERIVRAVASNRAQLRDVRAEILVVNENHLVQRPTRTTIHNQDGTTDISGAIARTTHRERIAISGDRLRYEITGPSNFDWNPDEAWLIKPGEWQLYQAEPNRLQIWSRPEQVPGRFPIDPRDYGAPLLSFALQKWLESLEARSAQLVPQSNGTLLARLRLTKGENAFLLECRSTDGFLPSLLVTSYKSGLCLSSEIQYQPVLDGKAWFPKSMLLRSFPKTPSDPRNNDCQFLTKSFVTKLDVRSGKNPRPVAPLQVPPGTQVQDMRDSSN